ncbi:histidinol-phosphate transaminase [Limnoraphis robusta]|uniref:Histidinol-phosphate aminotransferase n=1 Tax=Limnoraphis robusta CCNP1315 TaxID=3110306 RepID=A0ABU5TRY9_9CYAN|nr:histidinol-phosphate transaminase [Limnoraphis robusta]MEA5517646.1 histidinol-phosphate transaminase [Limnoraphis robusta CCNP1315]MEA5544469.1 histidinol-phosphate transaminase [Limnoraphis robusta CCNP1324]
MLPFIRNDLAQFQAYAPHPGGESGSPVASEMIIDRLDTNECPYDLPCELKQKLAWAYQHEIETNRYPDGSHFTLKRAIAQYVNRGIPDAKIPVNSDNLCVGNGSDELIRSLLIATCLGGEGSILVATPTFSMYGILAETLGIPVVKIGRNEDNFEMDLEAAQNAISQTQNPPIRVVFVVHPNSPTANALTEKEIYWLRSLPPEILVVIDEAYFEFSQTTLVGELPQHPNWVILRTFSKAFRLAGLRVGYAIANSDLIAILEKVRLPYNLPSFSQIAAEFALNNQDELLTVIPEIIAQRRLLIDAITQHPQLKVWQSNANFVYVRPKSLELGDSDTILQQIQQKFKSQGTLIRHTGGGLRITVGTPEENQRTIERINLLSV